jgi:hypothetical protein
MTTPDARTRQAVKTDRLDAADPALAGHVERCAPPDTLALETVKSDELDAADAAPSGRRRAVRAAGGRR